MSSPPSQPISVGDGISDSSDREALPSHAAHAHAAPPRRQGMLSHIQSVLHCIMRAWFLHGARSDIDY